MSLPLRQRATENRLCPPRQSSAEGLVVILGPRFVVWLLKKEVAHDCKRLEGNRLHRAGSGKGVDKNGFLSAELFSEFARGEQEEIFRP